MSPANILIAFNLVGTYIKPIHRQISMRVKHDIKAWSRKSDIGDL